MYIRFLDSKKFIECTVVPKGNIVTLKFKNTVVVDTSGFEAFLDKEGTQNIGGASYKGFKTVYRNDEETEKYNGYQLSNDGSVYVKPLKKVVFNAGFGGSLDGVTTQEVYNYEELIIPIPVADSDYEFVEWMPEIPTIGEVDGNKTYTAVFKSTLPEPEPEPSLEERVTNLEEENAMLTYCVLEMSEVVYA